MVDWDSILISVVISAVAIAFAALTWLESRKQRRLLETMVKALPFATKRRTASKVRTRASPAARAVGVVDPLKAATEQRRRLKLELEKERLEWRKSKDIAKALGWILDRLSEADEEYEDE